MTQKCRKEAVSEDIPAQNQYSSWTSLLSPATDAVSLQPSRATDLLQTSSAWHTRAKAVRTRTISIIYRKPLNPDTFTPRGRLFHSLNHSISSQIHLAVIVLKQKQSQMSGHLASGSGEWLGRRVELSPMRQNKLVRRVQCMNETEGSVRQPRHDTRYPARRGS